MSAKIIIGYNYKTKRALHIQNAENGLGCNCTCYGCKEPLIANQGKKKEWHYSHQNDSTCSGGLETALHKLAKQIIVENKEIRLPKYGNIKYENSVSERKLQKFIPDVSANLLDGSNVYFEIFHRHKNSLLKDFFYKSSKLKSIEIDMCKCPFDSFDSIKNYVLNGTKNKKIIFWENENETIKLYNTLFKILIAVGFISMYFIIAKIYNKIFSYD